MNLFKKFNKNNKKESKESSDSKIAKVNKAIQSLRQHITLLEKKKTHLDKKVIAYNDAIKKCLKQKNRNAALAKIKLRKQVEKRVTTLDNQIFNLEMQIMALDETLTNSNIMEVMKITKEALTINPEMIDQAEDLQEQIAEQMELNDEMNTLMSQPIGGDIYDDDELLDELNEIEMLENNKFLYGEDHNIQNQNKNKKMFMLKEDPENNNDNDNDVEHEDDQDDQDEDDDQFEKELKKLDVEMAMSGNCRRVVDVQLVSSSQKMLIQC